MAEAKTGIGILISGRGSNMQAIQRNVAAGFINAEIRLVISNKADAPGLKIAQTLGVETMVIPTKGLKPEEYEQEMAAALKARDVTLVCLAGYMRLIGRVMLEAFPNMILNIHPALLPAFPGEDAHRDVLAYGVKVSGCTVHIVDGEVDHGPIVVQRSVPVYDDDTKETLAPRVLEQEWVAYSMAINIILSGQYRIDGRRFILNQ